MPLLNAIKIGICSLLAVFLLTDCHPKAAWEKRDFADIRQSGELHVLTLFGSMSYFIYKGEQRGYEYELINDFAENHGLKLHIHLAENEARLTEMLLQGQGDVIAYPISMTAEGKSTLNYCGWNIINRQVLVQRANRGDTLLHNVTELIGKEVWVIHNTKYFHRIHNLNNELGGGILIRTIDRDTVSVEDLIEMVSKGQIAYTLADNDMAQLNKTYFHNINAAMAVSHPQRSSWAVRAYSKQLADSLDRWFADYRNSPRRRSILKRYFEMSKMPGDEPVPLLSAKQISPFDSLFRQYSPLIAWDWRLLASLAYQESKFYIDRVSWSGATGLMGLMPKTAEAFGLSADSLDNPEGSILAAVHLIKRLNRSFATVSDEQERIKFILAAYNAGSGHVYDAQALAQKYGKNPYIWDNNVEEGLKMKSMPEYYNDTIVKQGYLRATETVNYVRSVIERWHYYQEKITE
ncbi:MAG: transglycosylase SLT domain-containing protein [Candidatus Symbiothrix sp.]|jgi:membrane-bound lytic murein transglycosylase F|nr:transglycosylase SLT domain-containing protein [Candidatus Symbiothrix sp.]